MDEIIYYWQACGDVQPDHRISVMAMHLGGRSEGTLKRHVGLLCVLLV